MLAINEKYISSEQDDTRIQNLQNDHADLDLQIAELRKQVPPDELQICELKKKKLQLKDRLREAGACTIAKKRRLRS